MPDQSSCRRVLPRRIRNNVDLAWLMLCGLLACCVALQGLAAGTQRLFGPAHFHRPMLVAGGLAHRAAAQAAMPAPDAPDAHAVRIGALRKHGSSPHQHDGVAHHHHAPADASVVAVADGLEAAAAHALNTLLGSVHDVDSLPTTLAVVLGAAAAAHWPSVALLSMASHTVVPLERPPRG